LKITILINGLKNKKIKNKSVLIEVVTFHSSLSVRYISTLLFYYSLILYAILVFNKTLTNVAILTQYGIPFLHKCDGLFNQPSPLVSG